MTATFPALRSVVLDTIDARGLAEFYRQLLGYEYRPGDERPPAGEPDPAGQDWLVLVEPAGKARLAFQQTEHQVPPTWPEAGVPQQLHLDLCVPTADALVAQHERVLALGARLLYDRFDDPEEPLRVYADPAGHPFCLFVAPAVGDELEQAMAAFQRCLEARDRSAAEEVLDEDFALVLVVPDRAVMPRTRWLQVLGDYVVHDYAIDEQIVDVRDDCATVLQRVRMRASVAGADRSGVFVLSDVWRRRDGRWRLWRRHSTPLSAGTMPGVETVGT